MVWGKLLSLWVSTTPSVAKLCKFDRRKALSTDNKCFLVYCPQARQYNTGSVVAVSQPRPLHRNLVGHWDPHSRRLNPGGLIISAYALSIPQVGSAGEGVCPSALPTGQGGCPDDQGGSQPSQGLISGANFSLQPLTGRRPRTGASRLSPRP